jgi:hypothetical protein
MAFIVALRMLPIALLAASAGTQVIDEEQTVSAHNWGSREIPLHGLSARISASYEVLAGPADVRLILASQDDVSPASQDPPTGIAATAAGRTGRIDDAIRRRGDYAVVLDNRDGEKAVTVRLRVWLDRNGPDVTGLSARRQLTVVAISCVAFLGIVAFSAQRLRKAMKL